MSDAKPARSMSTKKPALVVHENFPSSGLSFTPSPEVADFTDDARPAIRVKCSCRNCGWEGQARFKVHTKIPLWVYCPKCEIAQLSAHGGFVTRDDKTRAEHRADVMAAIKKHDEWRQRERELRARAYDAPIKRRGLFG